MPGSPLRPAARQPNTIATVQNITSSGSMVSSVVPTPRSGVASSTTTNQNAVRAPANRVIHRSSNTPNTAPITGAKNRTPKAVSPQSHVPSHCV